MVAACIVVLPVGAHAGNSTLPPGTAPSAAPTFVEPGPGRAVAEGVTYRARYIGEAFADVSGGMRRGATYEGRLSVVLDADLGKLIGWTGVSAQVSGYQIHGGGPSRQYVGNLLGISSVEALPAIRLHESWLEDKLLDGGLALRVGQLGVDSQFLISDTAGLFVNDTFGWPAIAAADLPSGGPAYPLATPGVTVELEPTARGTVLFGLYNGDPAGPGSNNPQRRDRYGLDFRLRDPPLVLGEARFKYSPEGNGGALPGSLKLGAWMHFGRFADLRYASDGLPLADPLSNGRPLSHEHDYGVYGIVDQRLFRFSGAGHVDGFIRLSASPSDRNLIDRYLDAGLTFSGMIPGRPHDVFGLALAYARISDRARGFDRDTAVYSGIAVPTRDFESLVELTYQARITRGWTLQPDLQYVIHPGGNAANPLDPSSTAPMRNATVVGIRTSIAF